jgi:hypothetical protein
MEGMIMLCASSWRHQVRSIILILLCLVGTAEAYGSDTYNSATNQLTIPSVIIGSATYSNMVVTVGGVVTVAGGTPSGIQDVYNPATNQLTIPSVLVGSTTYTNVTITVGSLISIGSVAGSDTFDGTYLTIASIVVGGTTYSNVKITVGNVVGVLGGMPNGIQDVYNPATNQLTIPSVLVGGTTYTNVRITVGSVVSIGPTGGNASACFNPALSVTGTMTDVFYQNTNGTRVNTSELQTLVTGPKTFNGQSANETKQLLISAGTTITSFSYTQVQGLNVLTFGSVTVTDIAANYTITSYIPALEFSYSLASGQSITNVGTLTSTTVIGVLPPTSSSFPKNFTYTFDGFEDVTVPAGTFAGACKWTTSITINGVGNTGTLWMTRKGILLKTVAGATMSVLTSGTLNGGPVGP